MSLEKRVALLEQRLSNLESVDGIRDTISRYAWDVDGALFDDLADIFTDGAVLESVPLRNEIYEGKQRILDFLRTYRASWLAPRRHIFNERVVAEGENGVASAYWLVIQGHSATGQSYIGWGTYEWKFRLQANTWKITHMKITMITLTTLEKGWAMEERRIFPPLSS